MEVKGRDRVRVRDSKARVGCCLTLDPSVLLGKFHEWAKDKRITGLLSLAASVSLSLSHSFIHFQIHTACPLMNSSLYSSNVDLRHKLFRMTGFKKFDPSISDVTALQSFQSLAQQMNIERAHQMEVREERRWREKRRKNNPCFLTKVSMSNEKQGDKKFSHRFLSSAIFVSSFFITKVETFLSLLTKRLFVRCMTCLSSVLCVKFKESLLRLFLSFVIFLCFVSTQALL